MATGRSLELIASNLEFTLTDIVINRKDDHMYTTVPTNSEVAFWIALLCVCVIGLCLLIFKKSADSFSYIEDLDAWNRNYEKLQRRR